jgi:hypothetical protein
MGRIFPPRCDRTVLQCKPLRTVFSVFCLIFMSAILAYLYRCGFSNVSFQFSIIC